ncbi:GGDEF domain-containing protein [Pseudomonas cremoricolorata]|uniref:GGDEF domain-containing protein n=1 Tax=Pseudomonas cremoricolorata TaxID=157783 RepID=UPI000675EEC2|nr:GGDEF domain-containing protein [Pseudomonas cremoricolorata]
MDLTTLHLTDALVNLTCGAMCFAIWASRPRDRCFALWGMGSLLYGLTASWFPYLPTGVLGLGLGYAALQVANIMFWAGYRAFDNVRVLPLWLVALPSLPLIACLLANGLGSSEAVTNNITVALYCAISTGQVVYVLRGRECWFDQRSISAYAVILIIVSILATSFSTGAPANDEASGALFILTDHVMSIVFTMAVIAMVGQRDLQHLIKASRRDPLTGALNRAGLRAVITQASPAPGLILIDIDNFKRINDQHGHDAGDEVLRELVARTYPIMRPTEHLVRMGGEEFLIIADITSQQQIVELAERIRTSARTAPIQHTDTVIAFTLSIGVAIRGRDEPFVHALKRADLAMYQAKASGRDCVVFAPCTGTACSEKEQTLRLT